MKYRKKPLVIEATQFFVAQKPWPEGVVETEHGFAGVKTREGFMEASDGDWIITGVLGERYPCKPDVFEASYAPYNEIDEFPCGCRVGPNPDYPKAFPIRFSVFPCDKHKSEILSVPGFPQ
jgi:hypothetical protein